MLVEMLTALSPWHSKIRADSNQTSMMFMVSWGVRYIDRDILNIVIQWYHQ